MVMSEREIDPVDGALADLRERSVHSPRIVLTRHRAAIIAIGGYAAMALGAQIFLAYVESTQGYDDARDQQASLIFAGVMLVLCVKALVNIYRPVEPFPDDR